MRAIFVLLALALALAAAPAWAQDPNRKDKDKDKEKEQSHKPKRQSNLSTTEEIDAVRSEVPDAYQLIERLRPQYFRLRGGSGRLDSNQQGIEIQVVIDNAGRGNLTVLHSIPTSTLKEVRYLNGNDASIQFGTNYGAGAILVFTR